MWVLYVRDKHVTCQHFGALIANNSWWRTGNLTVKSLVPTAAVSSTDISLGRSLISGWWTLVPKRLGKAAELKWKSCSEAKLLRSALAIRSVSLAATSVSRHLKSTPPPVLGLLFCKNHLFCCRGCLCLKFNTIGVTSEKCWPSVAVTLSVLDVIGNVLKSHITVKDPLCASKLKHPSALPETKR